MPGKNVNPIVAVVAIVATIGLAIGIVVWNQTTSQEQSGPTVSADTLGRLFPKDNSNVSDIAGQLEHGSPADQQRAVDAIWNLADTKPGGSA
jgi:hypothetical protein